MVQKLQELDEEIETNRQWLVEIDRELDRLGNEITRRNAEEFVSGQRDHTTNDLRDEHRRITVKRNKLASAQAERQEVRAALTRTIPIEERAAIERAKFRHEHILAIQKMRGAWADLLSANDSLRSAFSKAIAGGCAELQPLHWSELRGANCPAAAFEREVKYFYPIAV